MDKKVETPKMTEPNFNELAEDVCDGMKDWYEEMKAQFTATMEAIEFTRDRYFNDWRNARIEQQETLRLLRQAEGDSYKYEQELTTTKADLYKVIDERDKLKDGLKTESSRYENMRRERDLYINVAEMWREKAYKMTEVKASNGADWQKRSGEQAEQIRDLEKKNADLTEQNQRCGSRDNNFALGYKTAIKEMEHMAVTHPLLGGHGSKNLISSGMGHYLLGFKNLLTEFYNKVNERNSASCVRKS